MSDLGNKKVIAKNIKYYMDLKNLTRRDVCNALGFKYTTFTDWVMAKKYPRIDKIELMANFFEINKSDLVEEHITNSDFSNDHKFNNLLKIFSSLSPEDQDKVLELARLFELNHTNQEDSL